MSFNYIIERGFWLPRIEAFCKYKTPSRFGDILEITLSIEEVKEKAVKYGFTVKKKDTDILVAEGYVVAVAADKKIGKDMGKIKEIIARELKPISIILFSGFGRGEGSYEIIKGKE